MKWASLLRKTQQCERYCTNYIIWGKFSIKFVRKIELDSTDVLVRVSKEGSWRQNTLETFSHFSNVDFKILNLAQWLWLSWQSGRFRHQRSAVQIPSLAKFLLNIVNCQLYWKDDNKEKEAGNGSFFWNKLNGFNVGKCYLNLTKKCNPNLTNIIL